MESRMFFYREIPKQSDIEMKTKYKKYKMKAINRQMHENVDQI